MGFFDIAKGIGNAMVKSAIQGAERRANAYDRALKTGMHNGKPLTDKQRAFGQSESERLHRMADKAKEKYW